ncbi:hypothetical protein PVAP13_7NG429500 [Panicum virgatum]|uniref:Uncharacterized protein n=1 Tax=Panicum virgatum TaxID=38727 RepID=A0A8T0Q3X4_PANVG|nr:hypothetical protein PVAP13_7NG429500 [Panicum virgatum]
MVATVKGVEAQQDEVVKNCFCMEGGQGETSYINNSQVQSRNLEMVVPVLKETLDTIRLPRRPEKLLAAADLGCSCCQNTLVVADAIVQHMTDMYVSQGHDPPEFCIYFSDLPSNDFNTLFRLLPGLLDKGSPAYNAGKVFVHGASEAMGAAYRRQFQSDLARFLRCRAAELKRGGAMFLLCLGRPSSAAPSDQGRVRLLYGTLFEDSWADLVREGLMDKDKMDGFNVPLYAPTLDEVREAVEAAGAFRINRLEMLTGSPPVVDRPDDPGAVGRTVANNVRSVVGALVDAHVGKALADELFGRLQRRAEGRAGELMAEMRLPHVVCSLSLARDNAN